MPDLMSPDNLYRRIHDEAQRRQQGPERLQRQLRRIWDRGRRQGNQPAQ